MNSETRERIERLRTHEGMESGEIIDVLLGRREESYREHCDRLRECVIDLLERSDPDAWTDERLHECGLVRLPKDRDGVTWHIGDESEEGEVIRTLCLSKNGWYVTGCMIIDPTVHRHRPPVTVESVLREFVERWHDTHHDDIPALTAEYASKLRLVQED